MKKYIAWLIAAPVIVFINYWLLFSVIFGITLGKGDFEIMIPAMIAVVLTILVRYPAFYRLAAQLKNKEDERNMV